MIFVSEGLTRDKGEEMNAADTKRVLSIIAKVYDDSREIAKRNGMSDERASEFVAMRVSEFLTAIHSSK